MSEVKIIVSGPIGSGKSALLGEIEIMCKALGIPVRYADEAAAQSEKGLTHADWTAELEMYKPSVVLVEDQPWRAAPAAGTVEKDAEEVLGYISQKQLDSIRNMPPEGQGWVMTIVRTNPRNSYIVPIKVAAIEAHTKAGKDSV
jgi:hypothetical protein